MKIGVEEFEELENERIAEFSFSIKNFQPESVRRSLRRAMRLAEQGPDGISIVTITLKDGVEVPPSFPGKTFETMSFGGVKKGCLEIYDLNTEPQNPEEGLDEYLVPLAAVESMQVKYSTWEPKPARAA